MSSKKSDSRADRNDDRGGSRDDDRGRDDRYEGRGNDDRDDDRDDDHSGSQGGGCNNSQSLVGTNGNDVLTGTSRDDTILGRDGDDRIFGLGGKDNIDGGKGNDYLDGGAGDDRLNGGEDGDDILIGGAGNDYLDGGPHGHDVARYSGNYADYQITRTGGSGCDEGYVITVRDNRNIANNDGTDTLRRIEALEFADRTIYIDGRNNAPIAAADTAGGTEDVALTISAATLLANDRDPDGNALTITAVGNATHGTVALQGTNVVFTPAANYNGPATFTYTVSDGKGGTSTATVTVNLAAVNDAPVAVGESLTTAQNVALVVSKAVLLANDSDVDGDVLSVSSVGGASHGTVTTSGSNVVFTPAANYTGTASFTYTVSDGHGGYSTATVAVNVTGASGNHNPIAVADTAQTNEDTAVTIAVSTLLANDTDADNDALVISSVTSGTGGTATLSGNNVVFTPTANFNGAANFSYAVSDGHGGSASATVTVNVAAVNDAPIAFNDTLAATEDTPVIYTASQLTINDTDVDHDPLSIASVTSGTGGTAVLNANGTITFTPNLNFNGPASFTYTVTDGALTSNTATVRVNVAAVNDAPEAPPQFVPAIEGGSTANYYPLLTAHDVDSPTLTVTVDPTSIPYPAGVSVSIGTSPLFKLNPTDPAYNPLAKDEVLPVTVNYSVSDGSLSTQTSVTFNITGTNDKPLLISLITDPVVGDLDTTLPDAGRSLVGRLETYDPDHGAIQTYSIAGAVAADVIRDGMHFDLASTTGTFGTLYLNSHDGNYAFVYNAELDKLYTDVTGSDSFSVTVTDEWDASDGPRTLTVDLTGINDATVISGVKPFDYTVGQVAKVVAPDLILNDPDSNRVTSALVEINHGFTPVEGLLPADALGFDTGTLQSGVNVTHVADSNVWTFTIIATVHSITATYNPLNGQLSFTGLGSLDEYKDLLNSVTFHADSAGVGPRTIAFTVFDDTLSSNTVDTASLSLLDLTTTGFRIPGHFAGDSSGFSVSAAGDVNNDGYGDFIIGAPWFGSDWAAGTDGFGRSYIVYGKSADFAADYGYGLELPVSSLVGTTGFSISGELVPDRSGFSVKAAGDVNGDGFSDVIIGAPYADRTGHNSGISYVVFGNSSSPGADLNVSTLTGSNGFSVIGSAASDFAGYSVSGAGDVDGDGFADLIIGAPQAFNGSTTPTQSGMAYVLFGHNTPFANLDLSALASTDGFSLSGVSELDWVGASVSNAGDINGDGYGDLIIGTATPMTGVDLGSGLPMGVPATASAYVVFGSATGFGTTATDGQGFSTTNLDLSTLTGSKGFSLSGAGTGVQLSGVGRGHYAVRAAGDVNGDGFADVIIGAPYANTSNGQAGAAYVVFGHGTGTAFAANLNLQTLDGTNGFKIIGAAEGDRAGYAVSAAGDVNGDGYGDLIIGAPSAQANALPAGMSYIVFGSASGFGASGTPGTVDLNNLGTAGFRISAVGPHNDSGYGVSATGDVNGDGFADLIVASSAADPHTGTGAGESYVIFGAKFITLPYTQVGSLATEPPTTFVNGTIANDIFVAGQHGATMVGGGGKDSFSGGIGNDTIHLGAAGSSASDFLKIDGGGGFDTLVLDGSGMSLNLTTPGVAARIQNIERIDLGGHGNTVALNIHDVLNMSENSNTLQIAGGINDQVNVVGTTNVNAVGTTIWIPGADQTIGSVTYHAWDSGLAHLLIDSHITPAFG